jgi:hypothetical protein
LESWIDAFLALTGVVCTLRAVLGARLTFTVVRFEFTVWAVAALIVENESRITCRALSRPVNAVTTVDRTRQAIIISIIVERITTILQIKAFLSLLIKVLRWMHTIATLVLRVECES